MRRRCCSAWWCRRWPRPVSPGGRSARCKDKHTWPPVPAMAGTPTAYRIVAYPIFCRCDLFASLPPVASGVVHLSRPAGMMFRQRERGSGSAGHAPACSFSVTPGRNRRSSIAAANARPEPRRRSGRASTRNRPRRRPVAGAWPARGRRSRAAGSNVNVPSTSYFRPNWCAT